MSDTGQKAVNASLDEKSVDEKRIETSSNGSFDLQNGDEALKLIDAEKVVTFSEEYNLKLRWKLVCRLLITR
jgi:hypothetical protein